MAVQKFKNANGEWETLASGASGGEGNTAGGVIFVYFSESGLSEEQLANNIAVYNAIKNNAITGIILYKDEYSTIPIVWSWCFEPEVDEESRAVLIACFPSSMLGLPNPEGMESSYIVPMGCFLSPNGETTTLDVGV